MRRDNAFLVAAIAEVSQGLRAASLTPSDAIVRAGEVLDNMSGLLINNQCPPSAQAEYVLYLLRAEKFRQTHLPGNPLVDVSDLSRLIFRLKAIRRRLQTTEETWRFRSWGSSRLLFLWPGYLSCRHTSFFFWRCGLAGRY